MEKELRISRMNPVAPSSALEKAKKKQELKIKYQTKFGLFTNYFMKYEENTNMPLMKPVAPSSALEKEKKTRVIENKISNEIRIH